MGRIVTIDPVTRIEGRARVTIGLDDGGRVTDARVQVTELRGFELLCVGRPLREMPALTSRICGICPVSHSLAAAKAGDVILGAEPPPAARRLRALLQLAQLVQSHALAFFYLSAPDLWFGHDADPARRSFFGLAEGAPELARDGVGLRRFGQETIERVAGRRIHASFTVPGGVARPLGAEARDLVATDLPGALSALERTLAWWKEAEPGHAEEAESCGRFETAFLALLGPGGELDLSEGRLRLVGAGGEVLADGVDPAGFATLLSEQAVGWSYLKPARHSASVRTAQGGDAGDGDAEEGASSGLYRVGPLARLNAATRCGTPRADRELAAFRSLARGPVLSTFHAHRARLVEMLFALERMGELLADPGILDTDVLAPPGERRAEGVGACEAPRGTLFHRYRVDGDGLVTWAELVVATGQNGLAMDRAVRQVADRYLSGTRITEGLLNRVEAAVRAFDPCLSCSTHALGERRVALRLLGPGGRVLDEWPEPGG
jgi:NAD-reducing hydrogenase large subunit